MNKTITYIVFLCLFFQKGYSQKVYFENYTVNDNIPSSQINTLYQDSYGFIWIGSEEGPRKFDGISFRELYTKDEKEITGAINSINETSKYIYLANKRSVFRSNGSVFIEQPFYTKQTPYEINKTLVLDSEIVILSTNGLWLVKSNRIEKINCNTTLDRSNITAGCYQANKKLLWINSESQGLIIYDLAKNKVVTSQILGINNPVYNQISDIYLNKNGIIYIAVEGKGLFKYEHEIEQIQLPEDFNLKAIKKIEVDKSNNVWLATLNDGLVKVSNFGYKKYDKNSGINYTECLSVLNDKEGNTWLGTLRGGLFLIKKSKFSIFNTSYNLPSDLVKNIKVTPLGTTYVLTDNGLAIYEGLSFKNLTEHLNKNIPTSLAVSDDDVAAVGCIDGSVYFFNGETLLHKIKIGKNDITALHFLNAETLIASNTNGELFQINTIQSSVIKIVSSFNHNMIYAITSDGINQIWLATENGIYKIEADLKIIRPFETQTELNTGEIFDILYQNKKLYITTNCCGVWRYDLEKNKYISLTKKDGLSSNATKAFYIENETEAFVTTNNMLNHIIFKDSTSNVKQYKAYSNNDNTEFSIACLVKDYFGNILAGTNNGLLVFNPIEDSISKVQPKIVIESVLLSNKFTDWTANYPANLKTGLPYHLVLKYNQNDLAFEFIGLKYSTNEKFYYSYKLIGLSDEWIYCKQQNKAVFSNLNNGDYEFLARVSTNNKTWSNPISFKFSITPPFWKTPLFIILILITFLVIAYIVFKNQATYNSDLVEKSNANNVSLKSARTIIVFGSIIIPLGGLVYNFIYEGVDFVVFIHFLLGFILLLIIGLTFISDLFRKNINQLMLVTYIIVLVVYQIIIYVSSIEAYFIISIILAITTASAIINSIKTYIIMSVLVLICSIIIAVMVQNPHYSQGLYIFGVISACSIGVLLLLVRLNLSDKLIFADTVINKGSSLVIATNKEAEVIYVNTVFENSFGYKEEEVLGDKYWKLNTGDKSIDFVKQQIKDKTINKSNAVLITTKSSDKKWIQWENNYIENDILIGIGTDITDRVLAQETLDEHNKRLAVLNDVKENILSAKDVDDICKCVLISLSKNVQASTLMSIHLNSDWQNETTIYTINKDNIVSKIPSNYENYSSIQLYFPDIIINKELILTAEYLDVWEPLFFYLKQPYASTLVVPIIFENIIIGFINFFAPIKNAYKSDDSWVLNDIGNSVSAFISSYKQKQIIEEKNRVIEKHNRYLDILNKSKQQLLTANDITSLYKALILVLNQYLDNITRLSICHFNLQKKIAKLYFINKSNIENEIESSTISTNTISTIPTLLRDEFYYKPDFETEVELTEDDKYWYDKGIRSVLCSPINIDGELFGSVNLLSSTPNNFEAEHKDLITEIIDFSETIIEQILYKNIIAEKNKDITDNIVYAKRIQDAIMPNEIALQQSIPESFLFFSQKDILGGDFYWFDKIDNRTFIVVGDCTGHGVSGALLSILASDIIKQAVLEMHLTDSGNILEHLNWKIQNTLNQHNTGAEIIDGLDISIAIINHQLNVMSFSSAMHTGYLVRDNELIEIKGNRRPIGAGYEMSNTFFGTHMQPYYNGDCFYLLTDGYCDQFHFETSKKYGKNRFKQMLLTMNDKSIYEQKQTIIDTYFNWKGDIEQTDDVCLIGFKL